MKQPLQQLRHFNVPPNLVKVAVDSLFEEELLLTKSQKPRLQGLLTAFDVKDFHYVIENNDKIVIRDLLFRGNLKDKDSLECKFMNFAINPVIPFFDNAFLEPKTLIKLNDGAMLLENLVNPEVRDFCVLCFITAPDLYDLPFALTPFAKDARIVALFEAKRLTLDELRRLEPSDRDALVSPNSILDEQEIYSAIQQDILTVTQAINSNKLQLINDGAEGNLLNHPAENNSSRCRCSLL